MGGAVAGRALRVIARPRLDRSEAGATYNAAETEVRRRRVERLPLARCWSIAEAIVRGAEVGAALYHASRYPLVARLGCHDARVSRHAAWAFNVVRMA